MKTELREYQREAVKAFLARGRGIIKAYPGAGKTIITCFIIEELKNRDMLRDPIKIPGHNGPFLTLVITPTLELVRQWRRVLDGQGILDVVTITYAKAARLLTKPESWASFKLLVFDEVHHLAEGPVFMQLLIPAFKAPYALGLTSTPPTDPENVLLRVLPVIYEKTLEEGLEEGYAAPLEIHLYPIFLNAEERGWYQDLTDGIRIKFRRLGCTLKEAMVMKSRDAAELKLMLIGRKRLLTFAEAKFEYLSHLVHEINQEDTPSRIFVWSELVDALEKAHTTLNTAGIRSATLHGRLPKAIRRNILEGWGKDFEVLLVAKVGEEGLDVPECAHGIILAGARTSRQNIQRIGRLLRPLPNKTAKLYIIYAERTIEENLMKLIKTVGK